MLPDSQKADESVKQAEERLEGVRSRFYDRAYVLYWAITLKGKEQMIGNVRYWEWPGHPECPLQFGTIQYDLADEYSKDKQLAAEALRAVAEFGLTKLNLVRVQCTIRPDDSVRSEALLAAGFQKEGVLRNWWLDQNSKEWQDEVMFSLVAADMKQPQAEQPPESE